MRLLNRFPSLPLFLAAALLIGLGACGGGAGEPAPTPAPTKFARPLDNPTATRMAVPPTAGATPRAVTPPPASPRPQPTPTLRDDQMPPPPAPKPQRLRAPEYGVQAFMWWRPETADRDMGLAKEAGFTWIKQTFAWRDIEGAKKGAFDWEKPDRIVRLAAIKGMDLLARIDNAPDWAAPGCFNAEKKSMGPARNMQDWIDFVTAFVTRYKGYVRGYQVWNEPNLAREWCNQPPNPAGYAALLKATYTAIKTIDPNAIVISAGMTPTNVNNNDAMPDTLFIEKMYDAMGRSNGYFDLLGAHAPGFKAPPEMSPDDVAKNPAYNNNEGAGGRIYCFRRVEDIRKVMVARGDSAKQIAILEFGWTSDPIHPAYSWFRVDEMTKGSYIIAAFKYARDNWSSWIGLMSLIYMANPDWDKNYEEYWWAITEPDGTPRPGYVAVQKMQK